ncbi:hypothetical protein BKA62DRAFT_719865 [Auriculariales sp. MPI-PUGE-AT-0066]|nr:hypothetical protein BKA62DRAFT_719865 [Auriculariales sp. MPI-PUGE-AT-0066]
MVISEEEGPDCMQRAGLPVELVSEVLKHAALDNQDADVTWTAKLCLVSPVCVFIVQAAIYELYLVDGNASVREFIVMMTNANDTRRQHVRALVFECDLYDLLPHDLVGDHWTVSKVVLPWHTNRSLPPIQLRADFVAMIHHSVHQRDAATPIVGTSIALMRNQTLATLVHDHDISGRHPSLYHIAGAGSDYLAQFTYILQQMGPQSEVILSPSTQELHDRPAASRTRADIQRELGKMFAEDRPERGRVWWSKRDWNHNILYEPGIYRQLLCESPIWDTGEPLWAS